MMQSVLAEFGLIHYQDPFIDPFMVIAGETFPEHGFSKRTRLS